MPNKLKVLVSDSSALTRLNVMALLDAMAGVQLLGAAASFAEAMLYLRQQWPDVLLLDVESSAGDGLMFLHDLLEQQPLPVLAWASDNEKGARSALAALLLGAVGVIGKDRLTIAPLRQQAGLELMHALQNAAQAQQPATAELLAGNEHFDFRCESALACASLVGIGVAAAGISLLPGLIRKLPPNSPPVLLASSLPAAINHTLSQYLGKISHLPVKHAGNGEVLLPGQLWLLPSDREIHLQTEGAQIRIALRDGPPEPPGSAIERLFHGMAVHEGSGKLGILLGSSGDEGRAGWLALQQAGGLTLCKTRRIAPSNADGQATPARSGIVGKPPGLWLSNWLASYGQPLDNPNRQGVTP
jgi:two-component system chemotaxis response regulator CheB